MKKTFVSVVMAVVLGVSAMLFFTACGGVQLTGIALSEAALQMSVGETLTPQVSFEFSSGGASQSEKDTALQDAGITWVSSDESVATASGEGITAVGAGSTQVSVSDASGEHTTVLNVTVIQPAKGFEVPSEAITLALNGEDTADISASITPDGAQGELRYTSSDEDIASVSDDGKLTAVSQGDAIITVTLTAGGEEVSQKEIAVSVVTNATDIALEYTEGWIYVGGEYAPSPSPLPEEASDVQYSYASDDESIATVSEEGVIVGIAAGSASITVSDNYGNELVYSITVNEVPVYTAPTQQSTATTITTPTASTTTPAPATPAPATPTPEPAEPTGPVCCWGIHDHFVVGQVCAWCGYTKTDYVQPRDCTDYHGNGTDAGQCPTCGLHYSRIVIPGDGTNGGQAGGE